MEGPIVLLFDYLLVLEVCYEQSQVAEKVEDYHELKEDEEVALAVDFLIQMVLDYIILLMYHCINDIFLSYALSVLEVSFLEMITSQS